MDEEKQDKARRYFDSLYQKYGVNEKSLGWSKNKQDIRFGCVLKYLGENESVLDVGCGFGDMYQYLKRKEMYSYIDYYGIDIMKPFIDIAKDKNKEVSTHFLCKNMMELSIDDSWDWVVACGLFGLKIYDTKEEMYDYIRKTMERSLKHARKGISFYLLSDKVDYMASEKDFYASPVKILEMAYSFSRRVVLDNSDMPFEYCITVWKNDNFSIDTTVFER